MIQSFKVVTNKVGGGAAYRCDDLDNFIPKMCYGLNCLKTRF